MKYIVLQSKTPITEVLEVLRKLGVEPMTFQEFEGSNEERPSRKVFILENIRGTQPWPREVYWWEPGRTEANGSQTRRTYFFPAGAAILVK